VKKFPSISIRDVAAVLLVLVGLQLRAVETYELSPGTTRLLAGLVGPSEATAHGALRGMVIETTQHRHRLRPPEWLGWTCLSTGGVLLARSVLKRR
jgi:hypothetical protein